MAISHCPSFGDLLRRYRLAASCTQEQLSERSGVSVRAIQLLEACADHRPRRSTVELLADALGLSVEDRAVFERAAARGGAASLPHPSFHSSIPPLPVDSTIFIGRQREVAAVTALLRRPEVRLLTLTGTGGVGKTRLGLRVAQELAAEYDDGLRFVPLASIMEPDLIASAIATRLGIGEEPGRPLRETLTGHLEGMRLLLFLDNFEHLMAGAALVSELLACASHLKVLVTSREVLRLSGEHVFRVAPLAVPCKTKSGDREDLQRYDAVMLFMDRARAARTDIAFGDEDIRAAAELCARLDGLPLAIELAATRVRLLTPQELLARLSSRLELLTGGPRDLPPRQQTLRATLDWSFGLLEEREQCLFARLSVFSGGCTLGAAEAVCNVDKDLGPDVLEVMASLVDNSMLTVDMQAEGSSRFLMLETIREYGLQCLEAKGEMAAQRRRHALYCLALTERAEEELTGPSQRRWRIRLEREHDNLRQALHYALTAGETEVALRLCKALWRFWLAHMTEGRRWMEQTLAAAGARTADGSVLAKVLNGAASLAIRQGDYRQAEDLAERSLALHQALGDSRGIADSLNCLGQVATDLGDHQRAAELHEQSLALRRELGDTRGIAISLNNLGDLALIAGNYARAAELLEESLTLGRVLDNAGSMAVTLNNLGDLALFQGEYERAATLHQQSLSLFQELEHAWGIALGLFSLGEVVRHQGDYPRAMELFEESLAVAQHAGDRGGMAHALAGLGSVARNQGDYTRAVELIEQSVTLARDLGNKRGLAGALHSFGEVLAELGEVERARDIYEESMMLFQDMGSRVEVARCLDGLARLT